jgi:protein-disulfide isomerase
VTIVEFSDFQCPFCARALPTLKRIQETYGVNVRLVWKHLPLPIHRDAVAAALAAEAAGRQGRFWQFHDKLFANQDKLQRDALTGYARELELDTTRFEADMRAPEAQERVDADAAEALSLGVEGTPGFFINGRFLSGAQPFETFAAIIDQELAKMNIPKPTSSPN